MNNIQVKPYLVIDLSGGSSATSYPVRYSATAPELSSDTCRTTELWLRRIPAGTFTMGSPEDEPRLYSDETQHQVTLTQDYYIGVFEVTQKQYELVMGSNPSTYKGDTRPVERVSYNTIRGSTKGAQWPSSSAVDATSFMGKIRSRTGLTFDLPTEAQWEYACRAGTTTALNSGKNLTATKSCPNMAEVGRYRYNQDDGKGGYSEHTKVGSYLPNAWGLYDMHGNVWEWCLDWYDSYSTTSASDPVGADAGSYRVLRGGGWDYIALFCRSANRFNYFTPSSVRDRTGFRIFCLLPNQADYVEEEPDNPRSTYLVIDLSAGSNATSYPYRYSATAPDLSNDTCRTTELWLRRIPAGTFTMGSPEDELGRYSGETQHQVTLTQDYYIGVFEVTQKQYELVMGSNPSTYKGDTRPVERVSYNTIRGSTQGAQWPSSSEVDATSFMGKIRSRTGLTFDLPTEAQWEYACRAGTTTALNSGKNLTATKSCPNMAEVGRYYDNQSDGKGGSKHTKVGSYLPNAWGLYDMHGNVWEWCLDWYDSYSTTSASDPVGAGAGSDRVLRGGYWGNNNAQFCRSAHRFFDSPSSVRDRTGFRLFCLLPNQADYVEEEPDNPRSTYLVIDLSAGSNATSYPYRYSATAPELSSDTCRTTELWLRRIQAGTFTMGSPEDELGRYSDETQHQVTLTQDYYIGVFEVTQKQYELVMGSNPSTYKGDTRPVERVSYNTIRGSTKGAQWPSSSAVDATSFMGKIRSRTGLTFDLPTEAQWEYACRAGTTTALNSGKNLTATKSCPNMAEVGRYRYNQDDGKGGYSEHTKVGSYLPNAWGLYDMHGNVWEWCLDWYDSYSTTSASDPVGAGAGSDRVLRGGYWGNNNARFCRSAQRGTDSPSDANHTPSSVRDHIGFRAVCLSLSH